MKYEFHKNDRPINNRSNSHVMSIGSLRVQKRKQVIRTGSLTVDDKGRWVSFKKNGKIVVHADIRKNFKSRGERPYIKQRWRDNPECAPKKLQELLLKKAI